MVLLNIHQLYWCSGKRMGIVLFRGAQVFLERPTGANFIFA